MPTSAPHLFSSFILGPLTLPNRIIMAPMTRCRAPGGVPNALMARYYAARASAGLIITEGTAPSLNGLGYARIPGCFTEEHVAGWRLTTDAVHRAGGRIFLQLMHTGRASHPLNMLPNGKIVAPSALALGSPVFTDQSGPQNPPPPAAMTLAEIKQTIGEYAHSAKLAIKAGFDGVELHAANGYLLDQFLNPGSNVRTDDYGGTAVKRQRFVVEVTEAVAAAIGPGRLGIRLSPGGTFNNMTQYPDVEADFVQLAEKIRQLNLVYLHISDQSTIGTVAVAPSTYKRMHIAFAGPMILSAGYDKARGEKDLAAAKGELIAYGRPYVSNPDLVAKMRDDRALTPWDASTFYTPGEKGYTDYAGT